MLLKLGRDVAPCKIYLMVHILMLLWQHARFQDFPLSSKSNINTCSCMGQNIQLKMFKRRLYEGGTGMLLKQDQKFCLVESQMVIFNFEETGTEETGRQEPSMLP